MAGADKVVLKDVAGAAAGAVAGVGDAAATVWEAALGKEFGEIAVWFAGSMVICGLGGAGVAVGVVGVTAGVGAVTSAGAPAIGLVTTSATGGTSGFAA